MLNNRTHNRLSAAQYTLYVRDVSALYIELQNLLIIDSLFIFSVSKLLLDAASYDGEIWHADA